MTTRLAVIMRSFCCALHEALALTEHIILLANLVSPPWLSPFRELKDILKKMSTMVILKTSCMDKKFSVFLPLTVTFWLDVKGGSLLQAIAAQVLPRDPRDNTHLCLIHAVS